MNYGHFDELNKEYVITRPDTPSAWQNGSAILRMWGFYAQSCF